MSKDLKDLIDIAEEKDKSRAQLEKTIELLQIEVNRLEAKLKEHKPQPLPSIHPSAEESDNSAELEILKNMINSQRQELAQKEHDKEELQNIIEALNLELTNVRNELEDANKGEILEKTKNSLNSLMENYANLEKVNIALKERFSELEEENTRLSEDINRLSFEQSTANEIQSNSSISKQKIASLQEENKILNEMINEINNERLEDKDLENLVETLKDNNYDLEKKIESLNDYIDTLKAEKFNITKLETKISALQQKIQDLENINESLRERKIEVPLEKITTDVFPDEIKKPIQDFTPLNSEKPFKSPDLAQQEIKLPKLVDIAPAKPTLKGFSDTEIKTEDTFILFDKEKKLELEETSERKRKCPKCGNTNKAQIREMLDKSNVILAYPKMYGKKYMCGQCGTEWH